VSFNPRPRRFPRLPIPEEARVYDQSGRELGTVAEVSGNGMSLKAASLSVAESLEIGRRMRLTIVEPGSRETNVVVVAVRNREGSKLGMEFVEAAPGEPL
jgi:hypothetical protein